MHCIYQLLCSITSRCCPQLLCSIIMQMLPCSPDKETSDATV